MKWIQWNKNNNIPFYKKDFANLIKSNKLLPHMGHGEFKFAKEINGKLWINNEFDVVCEKEKLRYEVKKVDFKKNSFNFRSSIIKNSNSFILREIAEICSRQIFNAFKFVKLDNNIKHQHFNTIKNFLNKNPISVGINDVFSKDSLQECINFFIENYLFSNSKNFINASTSKIIIDGLEYVVPKEFLLSMIIEKIPKLVKQLKISREDLISSCLMHEAFFCLDYLKFLWKQVETGSLFEKTDFLVFVDENKGYLILSEKQAQNFIKFCGVFGKEEYFTLINLDELGH